VVRARLASTERGRQALDGLDADVDASVARPEAADVLREEIEADSALRHYLEQHLTTSTTHSSVVITGSRVSRSPISIGPLTINNTRQTRGIMAAAAVLLLALAVLAVYGGVQLLKVDDSPGAAPPQQSPQSGTRPAADSETLPGQGDDAAGDTNRFLTVSETKKILPTLQDMPRSWIQYRQTASVRPASESAQCHKGRMEYQSTEPNVGFLLAEFTVYACPSSEMAADGYRELVRQQRGYDETVEISMPRFGDESTALVYYKADENDHTANTVVRTGNVVLWLRYGRVDNQPDYSSRVQELTSMFTGLATG
jgi:hypothetical protein